MQRVYCQAHLLECIPQEYACQFRICPFSNRSYKYISVQLHHLGCHDHLSERKTFDEHEANQTNIFTCYSSSNSLIQKHSKAPTQVCWYPAILPT